MTPYYQHGGIAIYHGDCIEVMEYLAPQYGERLFDLLLTDPPYGIGEGQSKAASRYRSNPSWSAARDTKQYPDGQWDKATAPVAVALARSMSRSQIIFGGNFYDLPPASCWLVWDKETTGDFADCELAWTNLSKAVRRIRHLWSGYKQATPEQRQHPTQKPEAVILWALTQAPSDVRTVLDPFMGSGTTLVAAKRLGKSCVGIEREERYCEIAARRLQQEALPLEVA